METANIYEAKTRLSRLSRRPSASRCIFSRLIGDSPLTAGA